jgi:arylsulfatase A-like enzyme
LKKIGEYENTLIVITADHGHGFVCLFPSSFQPVLKACIQDVFGGADTKYLAAQKTDIAKRNASESAKIIDIIPYADDIPSRCV